tara:strand:- start:534 stop:692 length:159 start_codon:yes stop_codon:yes gene_type:complete
MFKAIQFALMYKDVVPEIIEFVNICKNDCDNKSLLMKQYWNLVKTIQNTKDT